jgi:hypothetical protein
MPWTGEGESYVIISDRNHGQMLLCVKELAIETICLEIRKGVSAWET